MERAIKQLMEEYEKAKKGTTPIKDCRPGMDTVGLLCCEHCNHVIGYKETTYEAAYDGYDGMFQFSYVICPFCHCLTHPTERD